MNERILQLARNALDKAVPQTWTTLSHEDMTNFAEVFAQLIVKECATAITEDALAKDCGTFMMDSYAKGMRYSAHLIKEHFGVEE